MSTHTFTQVDVFTDQPLRGNPLAVVHGADGLSDAQMQRFAHWTNLSETTFLLQPTDPAADYRVRIFTPNTELPFAGHPTLGSCHAWLRAGGTPKVRGMVVQQCGAGLVRVRQSGGAPAFAAPAAQMEPVDEGTLAAALASLGLRREQLRASQWMRIGPRWLGLLLDSAESVLAVRPDHATLKSLADVGLVGPHAPGSECQFELRAFAPADGIAEDPVTGSLNAGVAQWLIGAGLAPTRYLAAQGQCLGRAGRIHIEQEGRTVWVGGHSVSCVEGQVTL
ncbi:PhzF family phenazine biosynthesis protein [Sphaerotilaceae bacterium SBD11-9]